jgi:orotate phosphoribosyltransferase
MTDIKVFRDNIIAYGVLEHVGEHSEFASGMHGQKLDFDKIPDGSDLYTEWVDTNVSFIKDQFPNLPEIIVGVANGTNRLALDVARKFNGDIIGAVSRKDESDDKKLYLSDVTRKLVRCLRPEFVLVVEDVGTTGSNSVQVAEQLVRARAQRVEVLTTWKRRPHLERLDEAKIPYRAIIDEQLPTYLPAGCKADGFCAEGWKFNPRQK